MIRPRPHVDAEEDGVQTFYWDQGHAVYEVLRFASVSKAGSEFQGSRQFVDTATGTLWQSPVELTFVSSQATNWYVACGMHATYYKCRMLAQYEEYIVVFNSVIDSKMTYQHFEGIELYVDEVISSQLYP
jgi:hypothetical protein